MRLGPWGGWYKSCDADLAKLCEGVEPGGGRLAACLRKHSDQLSPACAAALDGTPAPAAAAK